MERFTKLSSSEKRQGEHDKYLKERKNKTFHV